jgi:hypothetical protein
MTDVSRKASGKEEKLKVINVGNSKPNFRLIN